MVAYKTLNIIKDFASEKSISVAFLRLAQSLVGYSSILVFKVKQLYTIEHLKTRTEMIRNPVNFNLQTFSDVLPLIYSPCVTGPCAELCFLMLN